MLCTFVLGGEKAEKVSVTPAFVFRTPSHSLRVFSLCAMNLKKDNGAKPCSKTSVHFSRRASNTDIWSRSGQGHFKGSSTPRAQSSLPGLSTVTEGSFQGRYRRIAGESEMLEIAVMTSSAMATLWLHFPFVFRIGEHGSSAGPPLLHEVCLERGWKEYEGGDLGEEPYDPLTSTLIGSWNFWWSLSNYGVNNLQSFSSWQVTNRMARNFSYTSKDTCTRYLRRLRNTHGDIFDLSPLTFNVPSEYAKLCIEHTKRKSRAFWTFWDRAHYIGTPVHKPLDLEAQPIWICKPVGKSQGRGISVFDTVTSLTYNRRSVVQEYITRPLLIGPYKWDLRIYVTILSLQPLVVYAYREGLVRFATVPFDLKNLHNPFSHLTNSSVNKQSPTYYQNKTGVGKGCKWSLGKLRHYFQEKGLRDWSLWQRIMSVLILTIIGDAPGMFKKFQEATRAKTFFLMGFDILVDRNLRPLLIEVNSNPSLSNDCEVDRFVKKQLLHDLFDLLNLPDGRGLQSYLDSNPITFSHSPTHPIGTQEDRASQSDASDDEESVSEGQRSTVSEPETLTVDDIGEKAIPPILHLSGPTWGYHEILRMTFDPKKVQMTSADHSGSEVTAMSTRSNYPVVITLPINRRHRRPHGFSPWKAGITLKSPCWENPPIAQGHWVRIFPFNSATQDSASVGRPFDVKEAVRQVQELLKFVGQVDLSEGQDAVFDALLQEKLNLTTVPWHPPLAVRKPRF